MRDGVAWRARAAVQQEPAPGSRASSTKSRPQSYGSKKYLQPTRGNPRKDDSFWKKRRDEPGLGFLGVAWAIAPLTDGTRWQAAVRVGVTLSIVGGIAPLIVPNAYLPDGVRHAHIA
jgi:hypothetical protein